MRIKSLWDIIEDRKKSRINESAGQGVVRAQALPPRSLSSQAREDAKSATGQLLCEVPFMNALMYPKGGAFTIYSISACYQKDYR